MSNKLNSEKGSETPEVRTSEKIRAIALGYYNHWLKGKAEYKEFSRLGELANEVASIEQN